jgi:hypothetical protein
MDEYFANVRPAARLVGIACGVVLASKAFPFAFAEPVQTAVAALDGAIGLIVWPFELLVIKATAFLHAHGIAFEIADHWTQAFILLWLFYGATWGFWAPPDSTTEAVTQWLVSGLLALPFGILFATVPLNSGWIFVWPGIGASLIASARLWTGGFHIFAAWGASDWLIMLGIIVALALGATYDFNISPSALRVWPGDREFFAAFSNEAFARLAGVTALAGVSMVIYGAMDVHSAGDTFVQRWANSRMTRFGFNLVTVTAGAAAVIAAALQLT